VVRSSLLPALDQDAVAAVRQWEYAPAHRNGVPVYAVIEVGLGVNRDMADAAVR
jgi:outer membrane biosynthesis protein TonB